jgi:hypothetical protein
VTDEVSCSGLGWPANAFAKLSRIGPCRGRVGELNVKSGMDFALRTCHAGGGNGRNVALFNDGNWLGAENRPPCGDKPSNGEWTAGKGLPVGSGDKGDMGDNGDNPRSG